MASPVEDKILYVDYEEGSEGVRPRPVALELVVLAIVAGIIYLAWAPTSDVPSEGMAALDPIAAVPELAVFDASSGDVITCRDSVRELPDFAIVVAGAGSATNERVVSRVVQFVVLTTYVDHRYGRDVRIESLCTLP